MKFFKLAILFAPFIATVALAKTMIIPLQQETLIPVNSRVGTFVQFPTAVKNLTPSLYFKIKVEGADSDKGIKGEVKTISVMPTANALSESVAIVFWGGKYVKLKFVPMQDAEPFYDLQFESQTKESTDPRFLKRHMALMKTMVLDRSNGFRREVITKTQSKVVGNIKLELVRLFTAQELTGYVYIAENKTNEKIELDPASFVLSGNLKTVATQIDSQTLEPCPLMGTTSECTTVVRIVTAGRGDSTADFVRPELSPENKDETK